VVSRSASWRAKTPAYASRAKVASPNMSALVHCHSARTSSLLAGEASSVRGKSGPSILTLKQGPDLSPTPSQCPVYCRAWRNEWLGWDLRAGGAHPDDEDLAGDPEGGLGWR
jgi:hypothetical protein